MEYFVRKEAENDMKEAYDYYEACRENLGSDFLLCIEEAFARIAKNPNQYKPIYENVHRALVRRFPYGVYYVVIKDKISIIGVVHARKSPEHWQART